MITNPIPKLNRYKSLKWLYMVLFCVSYPVLGAELETSENLYRYLLTLVIVAIFFVTFLRNTQAKVATTPRLLTAEQLLSNISGIVIRWQPDQQIIYQNSAAKELTAITSLTDYFYDHGLSASSSTDPLNNLINQIIQKRACQSSNTVVLQDQSLSLLWNHTGIFSETNQLVEIVSIAQDISHLTEQAAQHELIAEVVEHSKDGIMISAPDGRILKVNRMFTEMTGRTAEEVIGKPPGFLRSDLPPAVFFENIRKSLEKNNVWNGEIWGRHQNGQLFPCALHISVVKHRNNPQQGYFISRFIDITEIKEQERKIANLAYYDRLTELPNRLLFQDRLKQAISRANRNKQHIPIILVNLDRFKQVNESLGHEAGDLLLQRVASRIVNCVRKSDSVARIGGDEFGIIIDPVATHAEVINTANRISHHILDSLSRPLNIDSFEAYTTAGIGIVSYPDDGDSISDLLKNADAAVSYAKRHGPNHALFYQPEMNEKAVLRLQLVGDMRKGLERGEFQLHYQPTLDLRNDQISGVEALVRWQHPTLGMISPADFIPLAEESGLIISLGEWIFAEAIRQAKEWHETGFHNLRMAINLSLQQLRQPKLDQFVRQILQEIDLPPRYIAIELTESTYMADMEQVSRLVQSFAAMGIEILIDDFGTGYSSLARLADLSATAIKIDRSFVADISQNRNNKNLVSAMIAMGHNLGMSIIAEGIETEAQYSLLKQLNCEEIQGFLISKPLTAAACTEFLIHSRMWGKPGPEHHDQALAMHQPWKKSPSTNTNHLSGTPIS